MLLKKPEKHTKTKTKTIPKQSDLNDHTPSNLQDLVKHLLSVPKNMILLDISKKFQSIKYIPCN